MIRHKEIYLSHFGYGEQDYVPCEFCGVYAVDVHHIEPRGMGGNPDADKDCIENLMGVCRRHHDRCEDKTIPQEEQKEVHCDFMAGITHFPRYAKAVPQTRYFVTA